MVDCTTLIWNISKLSQIFLLLSNCMEVSISLSCLFVYEPPYQTVVVCCNSIFHRSSSHIDHRTVFYVRVGLAQARPNYPQNFSGKKLWLASIGEQDTHEGYVWYLQLMKTSFGLTSCSHWGNVKSGYWLVEESYAFQSVYHLYGIKSGLWRLFWCIDIEFLDQMLLEVAMLCM